MEAKATVANTVRSAIVSCRRKGFGRRVARTITASRGKRRVHARCRTERAINARETPRQRQCHYSFPISGKNPERGNQLRRGTQTQTATSRQAYAALLPSLRRCV